MLLPFFLWLKPFFFVSFHRRIYAHEKRDGGTNNRNEKKEKTTNSKKENREGEKTKTKNKKKRYLIFG